MTFENLPSSWLQCEIEVVLQPLDDGRLLHHGWSPQCESEPSPDDSIWGVLKTTAIQDGHFLCEHNKRLPSRLAPRPHLEVNDGDILITCAGPRNRCGVPCLVRMTRPHLILSGKMYRFRVREEAVLPAFMETYLRSRQAQELIDRMKTGISDSGLNLTHGRFLRLTIPIAPFNEQRRIVSKIEELFSDLDAGVAALERAKANLKRYRASVLKAAVDGSLTAEWREKHPQVEPASKLLERILTERRQQWEAEQLAKFEAAGKQPPKNWRDKYAEPSSPDTTNLPELPESWTWTNIEALIREPLRNGHSSRASADGNGIRTLTLTAVTCGDFSEENIKYTVADPRKVEDLWIEPGDIFIERSNTPELVGTARLYGGPSRFAVFPDLLIRIRLSQSICDQFVDACLQSRKVRQYFQANAKGLAGSMPKIDQATILRCPIPLPPKLEQDQIAEEVGETLSKIDAAEKAINHDLKRAVRLRQRILKDAFEGRLVPQDPADEPASELLARIQRKDSRKEKTSPAKARKSQKLPKDVFLRRASVVSYAVRRLASHRSFGRTQLEKTAHLTQCHLGVDLGFHFVRQKAGPFDSDIYKLEAVAKKNDWFTTQKRQNYGVTYHPGKKIDAMCRYAPGHLGQKQADLDRLLDHISGMNTDEAELFATAYAAWNDLLIDGRPADDDAIIAEVHGWHPDKKRFTPQVIRSRLQWMRKNGYIPTGQGERTQVVTTKAKPKSGRRRRES